MLAMFGLGARKSVMKPRFLPVSRPVYLAGVSTERGSPTMKLSLYIPTGTTQEFSGYTDPLAAFDKIRELAVAADGSGFHTIWAPDHFIPFGPPGGYVFEVWTTLA